MVVAKSESNFLAAITLIVGNHTGSRDIGYGRLYAWWRHQMETFSALLVLCVGNSPVTCEFPSQRPVKRNFDDFFYLCLSKRLKNNREAGDLRRHSTHFDVNVMVLQYMARTSTVFISWLQS